VDVHFAHIWHAVRCDGFVPIEENGSCLITIQFLCDFWRWMMVFVSFFLEPNTILHEKISATSLVLMSTCQLPLKKLAAVLIVMIFGI